MRLLKRDDKGQFSLTKNLIDNIPPYAILSHTWGPDEEEVKLSDVNDGTYKTKAGFAKLDFCATQAEKDGLTHFWVDSACIDKPNHSELSEAITSMFRWYAEAKKCYVYLSDVSALKRDRNMAHARPWETRFRGSRWFTRGWTLQELIAPEVVEFFSSERKLLGNKWSLSALIEDITGIPVAALLGAPMSSFTYFERSRWASVRDTTVFEDKVYCLLGIFDVSMPIIYGEREKALGRLKHEIHKNSRSELDELDNMFADPSIEESDVQTMVRSLKDTSPLSRTTTVLHRSPDTRRQFALRSLSFVQMESRQATIKKAHSTTCAWLLEHSMYSSWNDPRNASDHHGFLWIKGKPGAGKSTIMKYLHAHAKRQSVADDLIIVFFFNARGDDLEKTTIGMYRALLHQLFNQAPDLLYLLDGLFGKSGDPAQKLVLTEDSLRSLLESCVEKMANRHLRCFIDALDECDEQQVREMVEHFEEMSQLAFELGVRFSICFASRPYPTIDIDHGLELILEHENGHGEDLAKYVRSHLRAGKGKAIEHLKARVTEKANGVFMWAVLVTDILNRQLRSGRLYDVEKRLEEIPESLGELFKEILRKDNSNMSDMLLCLQWVLFAKRPLSREEFYFAMASGNGEDPAVLGAWDPEYITTEYMERLVLNSSKGLVELTKSDEPTVQFIHETVRDFLTKERGLYEIWPEVGMDLASFSHEKLKQCCVHYLQVDLSARIDTKQSLPEVGSDAAEALRKDINDKFPFLEYANDHVLYHSNEAAREVQQSGFLQKFSFEPWIFTHNLFMTTYDCRYPPKTEAVYILAEHGYDRLITAIHGQHAAVNLQTARYRYPLFAALANGHRHAVQAFLPNADGYSLEQTMLSLPSGYHFRHPATSTALEWAIVNDCPALAEILLDVPGVDFQHMENSLLEASQRGYHRVAKLLLAKAIDRNDHRRDLLIEDAYRAGLIEILKLLLRCKHFKPRIWRSGLAHACTYGQYEIAEFLLGLDTDTDAQSHIDNALVAAVSQGHTSVVELLCSHGADVNAQTGWQFGALQAAASLGSTQNIRTLIRFGADVNAWHSLWGDALQISAVNGDAQNVSMLIQAGANVNAQGGAYGNALQAALRKGCSHIVEALLEAGAIDSRGFQPTAT